MKEKTLLIVEDDESLRKVIEHNLIQAGYNVLISNTAEEAIGVLKDNPIDLVITDVQLGGMNGIELLSHIKRIDRDMAVIMITAYGTIQDAVTAIKMGAYDYITKPFSREQLAIAVEKAIDFRRILAENIRLHQELMDRFSFSNIIAGSPSMEEALRQVSRLINRDVTVLIQGESGTGKELVARALHFDGPRAKRNFVAVNCSAIPENLLESELFGHVKGAFTGALQDKEGKFQYANGGTLFLDEICDMRLELQVKLLRILEDKETIPVGSNKSIKVDVRIITATNKDLAKAVKENKFREDLYYRINVVTIKLPPLRDRKDDIPLLIQHFLQKFEAAKIKVDKKVLRLFQQYTWPGNVRELENIIQRAIVLTKKDGVLTIDDIPEHIRSNRELGLFSFVNEIPPQGINLEELEKNLIVKALDKSGGNQTQAANLLGLTRSALIYRMSKHRI